MKKVIFAIKSMFIQMNIYVYFEFVVLMINGSTLFLKSESYFYAITNKNARIYIIYIYEKYLVKRY